MVWLASAGERREGVEGVTPAVVLRLQMPMTVTPSKKVTVPVGLATNVVPGLTTLTVAVKVTLWPKTVGLSEVATAVVVLALLTTWVIAGEAGLALKLPSPLV